MKNDFEMYLHVEKHTVHMSCKSSLCLEHVLHVSGVKDLNCCIIRTFGKIFIKDIVGSEGFAELCVELLQGALF